MEQQFNQTQDNEPATLTISQIQHFEATISSLMQKIQRVEENVAPKSFMQKVALPTSLMGNPPISEIFLHPSKIMSPFKLPSFLMTNSRSVSSALCSQMKLLHGIEPLLNPKTRF
jgi:hypothetical protein